MDRSLEQLVWQRANHRCEYCLFPADLALLPFQNDHVISQKLHGPTSAENLALSCERCNPASRAGFDSRLICFSPPHATYTIRA
jgi:5-methylcytosine-specific restriction endonuclease McrA